MVWMTPSGNLLEEFEIYWITHIMAQKNCGQCNCLLYIYQIWDESLHQYGVMRWVTTPIWCLCISIRYEMSHFTIMVFLFSPFLGQIMFGLRIGTLVTSFLFLSCVALPHAAPPSLEWHLGGFSLKLTPQPFLYSLEGSHEVRLDIFDQIFYSNLIVICCYYSVPCTHRRLPQPSLQCWLPWRVQWCHLTK